MTPESKQPSAVYTSWVTINNAMDSLSQGVPPQIDRSLFPGLNWAVQNQLIGGLRFLKLIDENGNSSPELIALAEDPDGRKECWRDILKTAYKDVFAMDLTKASPLQLEQAISKYGVNGDTLEKAVRFFLNAAEFCGIPLSPHLQRKKRATGPRKKRVQARVKEDAPIENVADEPLHAKHHAHGTKRTIELRSGGSLEVSVSVDLFGLSTEDRTFVFSLIDELQAYEQVSAAKKKATGADTPVASEGKGDS